MPYTLSAACTHEELIKKSRFVAHAAPVASVEAALAFIATHSDAAATHNCWAYRIGVQYRFHDDGEPGGTAGRPILQAIEGQDMDRVVVLVVRWFGGVKLGAGGLVRAYGGAAAQCLRAGEALELVESVRVQCQVDFHNQARLRARLAALGVVFVEEAYQAAGVTWQLDLPRANLETAQRLYTDLTRGLGVWQVHTGSG